jgi:hypothetical protein
MPRMPAGDLSRSLLERAHVLRRQLGWRGSRWKHRVGSTKDVPREANFVAISYSNGLAQTQIYPFHLYAKQIWERYGATLCEIDQDQFAATSSGHHYPHVKWVAFQTWFDLTDEALVERVRTIREVFPEAELVYLDFFAPLDLRYARVLDPLVKTYVKKQLFKDMTRYGELTVGDTNLTDFYARRYGLNLPPTRHEFPDGFERKLVVGPNFCISPHMLDRFAGTAPTGRREIDVHARIAIKGVEWYQKMRQDAYNVATTLPGVLTVADGRVSQAEFFAELRNSKLCFSPFGYGEVCWRDYEAIFSGSLLVKPLMDHVRVKPFIFVPDETYVPISWDFSDYAEKVMQYLSDSDRRREVTNHAFDVIRRYVLSQSAVDDLEPIFSGN